MCALQQSLCDLIIVNAQGHEYIDYALESIFNKSLNSLRRKPVFNFSRPLSISKFIGSKDDESSVISQLIDMSLYLNIEYYNLCAIQENSGIDSCQSNSTICDARGSMRFCDEFYEINYMFYNEYCSSIFSYLLNPVASLTITIAPEISKSTIAPTNHGSTVLTTVLDAVSEIVNFTIVESTDYTTTKIDQISHVSTTLPVVLVLVVFLFLSIAVLAFLGYRTYKSSKLNPFQPVLCMIMNKIQMKKRILCSKILRIMYAVNDSRHYFLFNFLIFAAALI